MEKSWTLKVPALCFRSNDLRVESKREYARAQLDVRSVHLLRHYMPPSYEADCTTMLVLM
jgi:hypothetical protein